MDENAEERIGQLKKRRIQRREEPHKRGDTKIFSFWNSPVRLGFCSLRKRRKSY